MTSQTQNETFVPHIHTNQGGHRSVYVAENVAIAVDHTLTGCNRTYVPPGSDLPAAIIRWEEDESGVVLPTNYYLPEGEDELPVELQGLSLIDLALMVYDQRLGSVVDVTSRYQTFRIDDFRAMFQYSYLVVMDGAHDAGTVYLHHGLTEPEGRTMQPLWGAEELMELQNLQEASWLEVHLSDDTRGATFLQWADEGRIIFTDQTALQRYFDSQRELV